MGISNLEPILYKRFIQANLEADQSFYALLIHFSNGKHELFIIKYQNYKATICDEDS